MSVEQPEPIKGIEVKVGVSKRKPGRPRKTNGKEVAVSAPAVKVKPGRGRRPGFSPKKKALAITTVPVQTPTYTVAFVNNELYLRGREFPEILAKLKSLFQ